MSNDKFLDILLLNDNKQINKMIEEKGKGQRSVNPLVFFDKKRNDSK